MREGDQRASLAAVRVEPAGEISVPAARALRPETRPPRRRLGAADLFWIALVAAIGGIVAWSGSGLIPRALGSWDATDIYFQADTGRVFANLTDPDSDHYRSKVHPLFGFVGYPSVRLIGAVLGLDRFGAVRAFQAICGAFPPALLYLLARGMGVRRPDAALAALALCATAAFVFWTAATETYALGAASILIPMVVLAWLPPGRTGRLGLIAASVASAAITITNVMSGAIAAVAAVGWRRAAIILYQAAAVVVLLWGIQFVFIPSVRFPLDILEERKYVTRGEGDPVGHAAAVARTFAIHSLVMPPPATVPASNPAGAVLSIQHAGIALAPLQLAALAAGAALLALGVYNGWSGRLRRMTVALGTLLGLQLALHLVYGNETFLYALHWTPALVALAAMALAGRAVWPARMLMVLFIAAAGANNWARLRETGRDLAEITAPLRPPNPAWPALACVDSSLAAKIEGKLRWRRRSGEMRAESGISRDGWGAAAGREADPYAPRGRVHIPIGLANTVDTLKTFVEPEGCFSPGVAAYGVYFWVVTDGRVIAPTQDGVEVEHGLPPGGALIPWSSWSAGGVRVRSEICQAAVPSPAGDCSVVGARVTLSNPGDSAREVSLVVALRALGPAGGRVYRVDVRDGAVLVNSRPAIVPGLAASAAFALAGDDAAAAVVTAETGATSAVSEAGDGSAALRFDLKLEPGSARTVPLVFPVLPGRYAVGHRWDGSSPGAQLDLSVPGAEHGILQPDPGLAFYQGLRADDLFSAAAAYWRDLSGRVTLDLPDPRWADALAAITGHLALCMNQGAPDVAAINYNVFNRDGVYTASVLQKAGRPELAAAAIDYFISHPFNGRVRCEADNPGQVLWIIGEQYRFTRDGAWLRRVYPAVRKLVEMVRYYRTTPGPHFVSPTSLEVGSAIPPGHRRQPLEPGACDGFHPEYTEAFDIAGLRQAAALAGALGETAEGSDWAALAELLYFRYDERFGGRLAQGYGSYCVLWPCRLYPLDAGSGAGAFGGMGVRRPGGWRYFPLAAAHQGLLAGSRAAGHETVSAHLEHGQMRGWFAFDEGGPSGRGGWRRVNTTWDPEVAMPHGWAIAEMALLIRDCLVFEDGAALVVLGGVPPEWFDRPMRIRGLPTHAGELGLEYEPTGAGGTLRLSGPAASHTVVLRLPPERGPAVTAGGRAVPVSARGDAVIEGGGMVEVRFTR